ncbi:MAG TPA: sulfur carrier protein ThiS [Solirubrobacteraceae bacterium]|nr:sulfur carrier protein ThiS [Solirubrobacteraceae bacterium]
MTSILLNGERTSIDDGTTVEQLLGHLDVPPQARGVAVAVDAEVIPRGEWEQTVLADGAQVEVVTAVQGG